MFISVHCILVKNEIPDCIAISKMRIQIEDRFMQNIKQFP